MVKVEKKEHYCLLCPGMGPYSSQSGLWHHRKSFHGITGSVRRTNNSIRHPRPKMANYKNRRRASGAPLSLPQTRYTSTSRFTSFPPTPSFATPSAAADLFALSSSPTSFARTLTSSPITTSKRTSTDKYGRKVCKCGSSDHCNISSKHCPLNQRNQGKPEKVECPHKGCKAMLKGPTPKGHHSKDLKVHLATQHANNDTHLNVGNVVLIQHGISKTCYPAYIEESANPNPNVIDVVWFDSPTVEWSKKSGNPVDIKQIYRKDVDFLTNLKSIVYGGDGAQNTKNNNINGNNNRIGKRISSSNSSSSSSSSHSSSSKRCKNAFMKDVTVGTRIGVYWKLDQRFYFGTIMKTQKDKHFITYEDDGTSEWLKLEDETISMTCENKVSFNNNQYKTKAYLNALRDLAAYFTSQAMQPSSAVVQQCLEHLTACGTGTPRFGNRKKKDNEDNRSDEEVKKINATSTTVLKNYRHGSSRSRSRSSSGSSNGVSLVPITMKYNPSRTHNSRVDRLSSATDAVTDTDEEDVAHSHTQEARAAALLLMKLNNTTFSV